MTLTILLTADNSFTYPETGLVVIPPLPPPTSSMSAPLRRHVALERPDGVRSEIEADFTVGHISLTAGGCRFAMMMMLPGRSRTDVPLGSRISVDAETLAALPLAKEQL